MRAAAIDIGSNSTILLVADIVASSVELPVHEEIRITQLGEGLARGSLLSEEAMDRNIAVIAEYSVTARALGSERILATATSAVRDSANGQEFVRRVQEHTGLTVHVATPAEEARLTLVGVLSDAALSGRRITVLDIGGGSTEVIQGSIDDIEAVVSIPLGCVRLRNQVGDATTTEEFETLMAAATQALAPLRHFSPTSDRLHLIGVGGTVTTLAAIDADLQDESYRRIDKYQLGRSTIHELVRSLTSLPPQERGRLPGLPAGRADTILPGTAILLAAMQALHHDVLAVSVRGLRYGVLLQTTGMLH